MHGTVRLVRTFKQRTNVPLPYLHNKRVPYFLAKIGIYRTVLPSLATSLARVTSFNKHNGSCFFFNWKSALKELIIVHQIFIYNADETGCTTVQSVNNAKVIACRKEKQVGKLTSDERGIDYLMICGNSAGNGVPIMMVFPRVNFKQHMMKAVSSLWEGPGPSNDCLCLPLRFTQSTF